MKKIDPTTPNNVLHDMVSYLLVDGLVHDLEMFLLWDVEGGFGKVQQLTPVDHGVGGVHGRDLLPGGRESVALVAPDLVRYGVQDFLVQFCNLKGNNDREYVVYKSMMD